jgi:MFS family permease
VRHSLRSLVQSAFRKTLVCYVWVFDHGCWCGSARFCTKSWVAISNGDIQIETKPSLVGMYIFARMVLGFGIVMCIVSASSLIGELGHPNDRATLTSFFNASYFFGSIAASAIAIPMSDVTNNWSWRLPSLLQMCPSLLQITFIL